MNVLQGLGDFLHKHEGTWWCAHAFVAVGAEGDLVGSAEGEALWATREELLGGTYGEVVARILATYDRLMKLMRETYAESPCEDCDAQAGRAAHDPDTAREATGPTHGEPSRD